MATKTATRPAARTRKKAQPEPEEDIEDELDAELEEDEEEEEAPAPKPRSRTKKAAAPAKAAPKKATTNGKAVKEGVLGTAWLKDHVSETIGSDVESTKLRIVLRKLIKDGDIESPKDGRYQFDGPRDPNVKAVVAALRAEAKSGPAKRGRKPKGTKVAAEVDDSEDEVEDLDLDDDE